jgi:hypothetical protein
MGVEHVIPPADPMDAIPAITRCDAAAIEHIHRCPRCRVAWYRVGAFRAGCTDPRIGALVTASVDHVPRPATVRAHLAACLACHVFALDAAAAVRADR